MEKVILPPTHIGIGVEKCGTTWLWECLNEHPEISMSKPKELYYFNNDENYLRGNEWYQGKFDSSRKVSSEITPSYFNSHTASKRIANDYPNAKLYLILRNPIDRILSDLAMHSRDVYGVINSANAKKILKDNPLIFDTSVYTKFLLNYKKYYDNGALKVFWYDDIVENPEKFILELCEYFEVKSYAPKSLYQNFNASGEARFFWLYNSILKMSKVLRRLHLGVIVVLFHRWKISDWIIYKFTNKNNGYKLVPEEVLSMEQISLIKNDIELLDSIWNLNVPKSWY